MSFVVAVLPAYNEEIAIGSVVLRTKECVDEVIVIDDGSLDQPAYAVSGHEVARGTVHELLPQSVWAGNR